MTYKFNITQNPEELYEILKLTLLKAFSKPDLGLNYIGAELVDSWRDIWEERDGNMYYATIMQVYAYGYGFSTDFIVILTPFDCYFGSMYVRKIDITRLNPIRKKELTKFYRQYMQSKYSDTWTNAFNEYIERVKKQEQNLAIQSIKSIEETVKDSTEQNIEDIINKIYCKMLQGIESNINEEQMFKK